MKKFFILGLLIFSLVLTGCNNLESKEDSETDKIVQKP
ncbi:putative lipoprotein NlpE involved in copper resistance, partial [Staphylococcus hominis]